MYTEPKLKQKSGANSQRTNGLELIGSDRVCCCDIRKEHIYKHFFQPIFQLDFCFTDPCINQHDNTDWSYHSDVNRRPIWSHGFFCTVGGIKTNIELLRIHNNFSQCDWLPFPYRNSILEASQYSSGVISCCKERICLQTNASDNQFTHYIFALTVIAGISIATLTNCITELLIVHQSDRQNSCVPQKL